MASPRARKIKESERTMARTLDDQVNIIRELFEAKYRFGIRKVPNPKTALAPNTPSAQEVAQ